MAGMDGEKLTQMWNIALNFYLSCFRCVVNFIRDRTVLGLLYKDRIS